MQHRQFDLSDLLAAFPSDQYPEMREGQKRALELIAETGGNVTLELPTGIGKTAVGYSFLKALENRRIGPLFYIVPTKTLVNQVKALHPDFQVAYGRGEYECLYYEGKSYKADEIPCLLLSDCTHRVNQETGQTLVGDVEPCPYYQAKYRAKRSGIVVCTMAFYLFTQLFSKEWETPGGLVIDEVHRLPTVVRNLLSYDITDYHLSRAVRILEQIGSSQAPLLQRFLDEMVSIVRSRPAHRPVLLKDEEILRLIGALVHINSDLLLAEVREAIALREIDPEEQRVILTKLERILFDLKRYLRSFEFSLEGENRGPLNYAFAYYEEDQDDISGRINNRLVIRAYYVAPIIKKLLSARTVGYSATIGDAQIFGFESGINAPFHSLPSEFPVENARIFIPKDTPNLAMKSRRQRDIPRSLRRIAQACKRFNDAGVRCLVVVISEAERLRLVRMCKEEGVQLLTYGEGVTPREAAARFVNGSGMTLAGTSAQYTEGLDLPGKIAGVTFFLRPSYPSPEDPQTQFEEKRFGGQRWAVWNWRVMIEALQVRGRNIRSATDTGVTIFVSQQFRRFVYGSLPEWLRPAYKGDRTWEEAIDETLNILNET